MIKRSGTIYHTYNPYKHLTREEIVEQLAIARKKAKEKHVMEAHQASAGFSLSLIPLLFKFHYNT